MANNESVNLAWLDLETTGLEPDNGVILEIGIVITTRLLDPVAAYSAVIAHDLATIAPMCDGVVRKMHVDNGLFAEVAGPGAKPIEQVRTEAAAFLQANGAERSELCGSTINFDRAWLKRHMSEFHRLFSYQNLDTTSLKKAARMWSTFDEEYEVGKDPKAHRAIADIAYSLRVAKAIKARLLRT